MTKNLLRHLAEHFRINALKVVKGSPGKKYTTEEVSWGEMSLSIFKHVKLPSIQPLLDNHDLDGWESSQTPSHHSYFSCSQSITTLLLPLYQEDISSSLWELVLPLMSDKCFDSFVFLHGSCFFVPVGTFSHSRLPAGFQLGSYCKVTESFLWHSELISEV